MDTATSDRLVEIAEAAKAAVRRHEADAELAVEERYAEMVEALDWHMDRGETVAACRLASALVPFWMSTNRIDEGDEWFGRLLAASSRADEGLARALHDHGYLVFWAGKYKLARDRFNESRQLAGTLGNRSLEALALAGLARAALDSEVDEAVRLLHEALDLTEGSPDDDEGRSSALHVLGVALQMSGDLDRARDVISRRLDTARRRGDAFVVWTESANLSMVERQLGNLERAEELSLEAVDNEIPRNRELYLAWTLNGLAAVTAAKGELSRAATILGIASSMLERAQGEWPPDEREQYDETISSLERGLTSEQLELARSEGTAMSREEALAYALAKAAPHC